MLLSLFNKAVLAMNLATVCLTIGVMSSASGIEFQHGPPIEYFSCGVGCGACTARTNIGCPIPAGGNAKCGNDCYCSGAGAASTNCLEV